MQKEKTLIETEGTKIYLKVRIKECENLVEKHANVKGRVHRDMWHFYMGKLCAYQQLLDKLEE